MNFSTVDIVLYSLRALLIVVAVALGWRDVARLFRRPAKNMGTGISRSLAVARTTMLEAWAGRIWLLPVLWLVASCILIFSVRPFDESERIPLYITMLLSGQEILMLVIIWVMASVSLPRERERKTLLTTASKPLSRLEILLGKIAGFTAVTGVTLAIMCVASLVILYASDMRTRGAAAEAYDIQKRDFAKTLKTPNEGLKQLSEEGSLFAYNSIPVTPDNFSVGLFIPPSPPPENKPAVRLIKGGSLENVSFKFVTLAPPITVTTASPGDRPYFDFFFPIMRTDAGDEPVKIQVTATPQFGIHGAPPRPQSREITLQGPGLGRWEPDSPDDLYSYVDDAGYLIDSSVHGEVTIEVKCLTSNVALQVFEGGEKDPVTGALPPDKPSNVVWFITSRAAPGAIPEGFVPAPNPRIRGYERHDRQEIAGPKPNETFPETAVYHFPGASLRNVPQDGSGNFTLSLTLETDRTGNPGVPTRADIMVFSMDAPGEPFRVPEQEVLERRMMRVSIPGTALGNPDPDRRGDLYVVIRSATPGHNISLIESSVRIELPATPFFLNFFKGELVVLLEALVLITVCVVCSVRLGWPVAMFLSSSVVTFGFMLDFLVGLSDYGGLAAINYRSSGMNPAIFKLFDTAFGSLWQILAVMARAVPNFTFYRYPQDYIPKLDNIPWHVIAHTGVETIGFILPVIAIGYLLFRKQELG